MAESIPPHVSRSPIQRKRNEDEKEEPEKLEADEIHEVPVDLSRRKSKTDSPKQTNACNICMEETVFTLSLCLCYICGVYLCEKCSKMHDLTHKLVKRKNVEIKRRGKANNLVLGMRGESEIERGEDLAGEFVEVIGRVNVKHELDKHECWVTGISGLGSKRWVIVDYYNDCIKIFSTVSNTLLRYITFGSHPRDVTEIKVQQEPTDPDSVSSNKTDISGATRDAPDKLSLMAVAFDDIKQIWFVDVNKIPAVKTKTIEIDKLCRSIDFSEDKIFTLCREYVESECRYSIDILSIEGDQLKVLQIPGLSDPRIPELAVSKGRVYLSVWSDDKVLCINVEDGETISELTLEERSWPDGISVDHNTGVVYLCMTNNNKVYKLSPDLSEYEPLSTEADYTERPAILCFINNKLYISHYDWPSSLSNVVTVVQVLT